MNTIYNFKYLNNQGNIILIQFIPNVCNTHSPLEVDLFEDIFEVKNYTFGFEKDNIKDKVCGMNVSTLDVSLSFRRLNALASQGGNGSEHYRNILECILNYKKIKAVNGKNINIYNCFIIKIDGQEMMQSVFLQREIYGSLTEDGEMQLTDLLSSALKELNFKKYYFMEEVMMQ